jgi:hypothetical protein
MARAIAISSGHGLHIRGASASPNPEPYNDEVDEVRDIVDRVHEMLIENGHASEKFHDDVSTSQSENLNRIVEWHNDQDRELDVSVHLNANQTTSSPMGCEVLYVTQETLAREVSAAIAQAGDFKDRGPKYRGDLAFLNGTDCPAILLEVWFCDSSADCANGRKHREAICQAIAEMIADVDLDQVAERPPIEPPDPDFQPPPEVSGDNRVEITGAAHGAVQCLINGATVYGRYRPGQPVVDLFIKMRGDVTVVLNGEEFHNQSPPETDRPFPPGQGEPVIPDNQTNIITTVFGGEADDEYSAYPPYDSNGNGPYLDDTEFYVALPWAVENAGPNGRYVMVINCENGRQAEGWVGDKGPWFVDDNYPELGTRPLAETCYENGEPCPRGPNAGIVPNGAGIDISPAMAEALGIDGKGRVDWRWVEAEVS